MTTKVNILGIEVDQFISDSDHELLKVQPHNLDKEWAQQPGTAAYFGHLHGRAVAQVGRLKTRRDLVEATIAQELRDKAVTDGEKITETKIDSMVRKDKRFVAVSMAYSEAQGIEKSLEALNLASRARKDALRHFSDKQQYEMHRSAGSYKARSGAEQD